MKLTLSTKFFADLLQLDFLIQNYVLSECKYFTKCDEDTILQHELPFDAPEVLVELLGDLKKRITTARQRRERRAAAAATKSAKTSDKQSNKKPLTEDKRESAETVMEMYELAVNVVMSSGNLLSGADRSRIRQLAKALMKRMDSIAAVTPKSPGRQNCRRA